jgi:hypothetical protein
VRLFGARPSSDPGRRHTKQSKSKAILHGGSIAPRAQRRHKCDAERARPRLRSRLVGGG